MRHYSANAGDGIPLSLKLEQLLNKDNGFFIELGAHDGLTQSNTAYFEFHRNWKGILIEPSYNKYLECVNNRKNSIVLNYACISNDYSEKYVKGDFNGSCMSSVNGKRLNNNMNIEVEAITLEKVLDLHSNKNTTIDLLSLDTEGYELNILKGLNLTKYRPKMMIIEIYNYDYENVVDYLKENGYKLHSNISNYNRINNPGWDGTHNDYLFIDESN